MIAHHRDALGIRALCEALGEPPSSWYRSRRSCSSRKASLRSSPRRLKPAEEATVLQTLNSTRFRDRAPGEIFATLLDEGTYLCSERTMYHILARHGQNVITSGARELRGSIRALSCWQQGQMNCGRGILPSSKGLPSGPGTTCTRSWTFSADT